MPVSYRLQDWEGNGYCDYQGYGNPYLTGGENYFSCMSNQYKNAGLPTRQVMTKSGKPSMRKGMPYVVREPPFKTFLQDPTYITQQNMCKGKVNVRPVRVAKKPLQGVRLEKARASLMKARIAKSTTSKFKSTAGKSLSELKAMASKVNIPGRSKMNKKQLFNALKSYGGLFI